MALYPDPPVIILMEKAKEFLDALDWLDLAGVAGFTVRYARNRAPMKGDKPCLSIGFVEDDDEPSGGASGHNANETIRALKLDLQFDIALATEDSQLDPTGWKVLLRLAAVAFDALRIQDGDGSDMPMAAWVDDVYRTETGPNEDSSSDEGRLVQGITMIYRVKATSPNTLLATGVSYP